MSRTCCFENLFQCTWLWNVLILMLKACVTYNPTMVEIFNVLCSVQVYVRTRWLSYSGTWLYWPAMRLFLLAPPAVLVVAALQACNNNTPDLLFSVCVWINCFPYTSTLLYCAKNANIAKSYYWGAGAWTFFAADFELGWVPADTVLCSVLCSKTEKAVQVILTSLYELTG